MAWKILAWWLLLPSCWMQTSASRQLALAQPQQLLLHQAPAKRPAAKVPSHLHSDPWSSCQLTRWQSCGACASWPGTQLFGMRWVWSRQGMPACMTGLAMQSSIWKCWGWSLGAEPDGHLELYCGVHGFMLPQLNCPAARCLSESESCLPACSSSSSRGWQRWCLY